MRSCLNLVQQGLLDPGERGIWRLTAAGKRRAERDAPAAATAREEAAVEPRSSLASAAAALANAREALFAQFDLYKQAQDEWMLARLAELSWREFEMLTGHILARCGLDDVEVTPGTHDGGIDGHGSVLIGIVRLRVAFQCKQQADRVGRPMIDMFRGAIQGQYDQGVFVSLSEFTTEAKRASSKGGAVRIELIDGAELVRKMLETGIGVTREQLLVFTQAEFPAGDPQRNHDPTDPVSERSHQATRPSATAPRSGAAGRPARPPRRDRDSRATRRQRR